MVANRSTGKEHYALFAGSANRDWEEAREYGFISAGGNLHAKKLSRLKPGDRVWVYITRRGYVGVGVVTAAVVPLRDFTVRTSEGVSKRLVELPVKAAQLVTTKWEPRKTEHVVGIQWEKTVPASQGVRDTAFFTNQNVACTPDSPRWDTTLAALRKAFEVG
jgi:hypothetical protein